MEINEKFSGHIRTEKKFFTYHLLGCQDREICINGMGLKETMKPSFNKRPEGNKDYLILYFYDDIDFSIYNRPIPGTKKRWIILTPSTPHNYGKSDGCWCHSWIHLSGLYFERQLEMNEITVNKMQDSDISTIFEAFLTNLHEEIYFNNSPLLDIVKNHISTCLLQINRANGPSPLKTAPAEMVKVKQAIDFRYHEKLPLPLLADMAGYSVPHLCLKFKETYGTSPTDYQLDKRIAIARHFLTTTDMRINEIGCKVGYDDVYYFSKAFKKKTGCSPTEFRKGAGHT